ncbi:MAG TPA: phosphatase PAP2 family protein [Gammaproteobacteria bacterium]|nr:phosphatase PAP2 family protein [Gammaproteobacteria bacterium]
MRLKTLLVALLPFALAAYVSYRFVDAEVARLVQHLLMGRTGTGSGMPHVPDLLLPVVSAVTVLGWGGRFLLAADPVRGRLRGCLALLGMVAPLSYGAKVILKLVFGRIRTRDWLVQPQLEGFHWFHGTGVFNGFPSGHMIVFTAMAAAVWHYYPRYRGALAALLCLLAAALVLLDYHFVSDVIAGAYCGLLVYWVVWRLFDGSVARTARPAHSAA